MDIVTPGGVRANFANIATLTRVLR